MLQHTPIALHSLLNDALMMYSNDIPKHVEPSNEK